jgi:CSLREA domain-containing protein
MKEMKLKAKTTNLLMTIAMAMGLASASFAATLTVTKTADTNDGICNADCSLREAIAVAASGDSIFFSSLFNSPQTIPINTSLFINKSLTIVGTSPRNVTIMRPAGSTVPKYRLLEINGSTPGMTVTLRRLTLTNGDADGGLGGGIFMEGGGSLGLDAVTIRQNLADIGGAVYFVGGALQITNSTISSNTTTFEGAGIFASGSVSISNSTISSNVSGASGGGIFVSTGSLLFNSVTVSHNSAHSSGGGLHRVTANVQLRNSIFAANTAISGPDILGTVTSLGNNLLQNSGGCIGMTNGVKADKVGTGAAPLDAQLLGLQNNGGLTDTRGLSLTSPAVNAGHNCVVNLSCSSLNPPAALANDQRGAGYARLVGTAVDIGAVENAAAPTITTISPNVRGLNTGAFVLTVNGTGFVPTSVVRWNGVIRTTTYASPTQLTAQILASDIQTIQQVPITVSTNPPGGGLSAPVNFNVVSCVSVSGPTSVSAPRVGGNYIRQVGGTNGCAWTATTTASWITGLTPSGAGDGPISFTVQPNNGPPRSAMITIRIPSTDVSAFFAVTQEGCTYSIGGIGLSVPAVQANYNISVTTDTGCVWTASSNHSFLTITNITSTTGNGTITVAVAANTGPERVGSITAAGHTFTFTQAAGSAPPRARFDFDGDGKTDMGIFRPADGTWWVNRSSTGVTFAQQFGSSTDRIAPADFTGDGKSDIAIWRPSSSEWFILRSEDFSYYAFPFGTNGDVPMPADYDGDGKADPAVFRPSNGTWYIQRSSGGFHIEQFGVIGDVPSAGDYDGDGRSDIAIYRPSNGQWWVKRTTAGILATTFGVSSDKPTPGDFTGDGKTDIAIWRPSTGHWFVLRSEDFSFYAFAFGTNGDIPAPGDFDGDGKADAAVFRPSNATWYSNRTIQGVVIQQFGAAGDRPVSNAFIP